MCLLHREGFCYCWRRYDFKSLHHVKGYHRKKTTGLKRKPSHNSHIGCFIPIQFSSVQFSRSVMSNSLWPHEPQHARPPCPSPTPGAYRNSYPLSWWWMQPSHPLLSPSPPALNLSQHQGLFQWVSSSHQVAKVLEFQLQHQSFQWTPRTDLF